MDSVPPLSVDLIAELDANYPPMSSHDLMRKDLYDIRNRAAQRVLIDRLKHLLEETKDSDLLGGS